MKKTQMQNLLKGFGFFLLSIMLATCEVGLGPSVDTSAPNLTVSSPTASAILKGTLSLGGTVSDDTTVTSVKVKFKGISSSNTNEYEYDATIDAANEKWSLSVNTLSGEGVKDGNYELTVTATDNSGKESYRTTTFYVDNTAPVIMVDTPDVKNSQMNYDVEFEGKLYDQSEVTKLTVVICDTNGNEKIRKDANVTNNSTWKATFDGDTELGLAAGNQLLADNGTYYYYVVATDAVNNTSEYFFHKPDVYTQFTGRKLDISEWASFDKGDTNTVSGQQLNRDWFNSIKIRVASMSSPSSVSIAPNFSYSSQDVAGIDWKNIEDGSSIAKDASIVGVITPPAGVDSPFKNETFKCYIFPGLGTNGADPFVVNGNELIKIKREIKINNASSVEYNENTRVLHDLVSGEYYYDVFRNGSLGAYYYYNEEAPSSDNQWPTTYPGTGRSMFTLSNTGTGRNFTISTGLPESHPLCLKAEKCWIYIEIQNSIGTKFSSHTSFDINPGTPTITITSSELSQNLQTTINTNSYAITGTSFTSSGQGCRVTYKISKDGQTVAEDDANRANDFVTSGQWSLPIGPLNLEDGTYSFTFTAAISGLRAVESRTITIDRTDPDLNIVAISQDTNGNKVTISGSANDTNGLSSVKYRLTPLQSAWQTPAVKYNWVYEIDTTYATEEEHTFEIQVKDMAGNTASDSTTIVIDHNPPELEVSNGGWSSRDVQAMTGTASDTHFDSLSVTYRNSSVSNSQAVTETIPVNSSHAWSWTPASTIADGIYDVTFEARDTANKTRTYTTSFTRDQNGPVIEEVSLSNGDVTENGRDNPLEITVRASDTPAGIKRIEYSVNGAEYHAIPNVSPITNGSTRSVISLSSVTPGLEEDPDNVDPNKRPAGLPEGDNTIEIKAVDNSDNETIYTYNVTNAGVTTQESVIHFVTDYHEPEVWFGDEDVEQSADLTVNDDVWVKGKLSDGVNTSKLKEAKLSYTKNGTVDIWSINGSTANGFTWNNTGSNPDYKWQWKLEKDTGDGRYTFKFYYKDIADNSGTKERTIIMDTAGPNINGLLKESGQTYQSLQNEIGVTFNDQLSGIDEEKLYWRLGADTGNDPETPGETGWTQITGETVTVDFGSEGVGKALTFVAYDESGNRSSKTYSNITVDLGAPTLYENVFNTPDTYIKNGDPAFNLLKTSGTVADDGVAIKKLEVIAKKDGVAQNGTGRTDGKWYVYEVPDSVTKTTLSVSDLSIPTFSAIAPSGTETYGANDGSWAISVAVYDRNLQKSEEKTLSFIIDASAPVMQSISSPAAGYITGSAVDIRGSINEPTKGTGIETVTLLLTGTKNGTADTETVTASGREWSYRLPLGDWDEGTISVSATATDRAGNVSEPVTASWTIDKDIPIIEETELGTGESVWKKGNFTVGGTVEDSYSVSPDGFTLAVTRKATGGSTYEAVASDRINLTKTPVGTNGKKYNWTATITVPANESAEYKITADATDSSGKHATQITRTVDIDMVAPTVEFTNLDVVSGFTGATIIDGSAFTIKGRAIDGASGIKEVKYSIDDATAVSTGITLNADRWELPIELGTDGIAEGQHTIEITAEDNAGNTANAITTTFVVDLAAPTLTIADITESSTCRIVGTNTYISAPLTLVGTVLDANPLSVDSSFANKMTVTAYVNGTAVTGTGAASYTPGTTTTAGTWSFAVPTDTDGLKTIKIVAKDAVGNETTEIKNITVDTAAPTLTVTNPGTVEGEFTLDATAYDNGQGIQWVKYSLDNTTWTAMSGSGSAYTATITTAALGNEGEKHIYVKAFDGLKETAISDIEFYYDTADPTLSVTRSTTEAYTNQSYTITIEDAYDENLTGVKIIAKKDNTPLTGTGEETGIWKSFAATNKHVTNQTATITEDGSYTFTVSAVDGAGNPTSVSFSIVVDATAPVVGTPSANASSVSNGNFVSGSAIDISGTLTEDGSGLETVTLSLSGTKNGTASTVTQDPRFTSNEWTYRLPLGDWDEGELSVTATATDKAGNSATSTAMTFVIDQNDPEVTETTIGSGSSWRHENFTVGGKVTDTLGLSTDGFTITVTKTVNGTTTTVDGITVNKAPVEGKGTATNCTEYTWSTTIAITANESAVYTIVANATDLSGRSPVQGVRRTVSIDTVVPVLSFTNLSTDSSNKTIMEGNSYTIEGSATDDLAGIASVSYAIDSGSATTEGVTLSGDNTNRTWKLPVQLGGTDGLSEGEHTITISAQDVAGNAAL